ncbi:MAG: hypothetical protein WC858_06060 [Parcubacteria group bacterium]|jgi:hypothetical protein
MQSIEKAVIWLFSRCFAVKKRKGVPMMSENGIGGGFQEGVKYKFDPPAEAVGFPVDGSQKNPPRELIFREGHCLGYNRLMDSFEFEGSAEGSSRKPSRQLGRYRQIRYRKPPSPKGTYKFYLGSEEISRAIQIS